MKGSTGVAVSHAAGKSVLGRENSKCKGPEAHASLADGRSVKEAHVRESNQMKELVGRDSGLTMRGPALGAVRSG